MDKIFQTEADTVLSERHSRIVTKFRKENGYLFTLIRNISSEKEKIKSLVPEHHWQIINNIFELMSTQSYVESKYLYVYGAKDCVALSHFLESEYIISSISEIIPQDNED